MERIRDYLVQQIKALRSPNVDARVIQQRNFLPYKSLFAFLYKHHAQLAGQLAQAYSNTMRWYYASNFARYCQAMEKLPLYVVDKTDALGEQRGTLTVCVIPAKTQGLVCKKPRLHFP